mmetsp:Transcript_33969/g.96257  ORF Transcript_33969/g.96257 Transcript_33969/m.96257 type:complete len:116 (-) Transcript_33969:429-776(-)
MRGTVSNFLHPEFAGSARRGIQSKDAAGELQKRAREGFRKCKFAVGGYGCRTRKSWLVNLGIISAPCRSAGHKTRSGNQHCTQGLGTTNGEQGTPASCTPFSYTRLGSALAGRWT